MKIDVLTLFPEFFEPLKNWSIIGRAINGRFLCLNAINIRDYSKDKHRKVDDYPFGGGHGMVMMVQPIYDAINAIRSEESKTIYLSPQGKPLTQQKLNDLSTNKHLILLCGHYEGVDQRVIEELVDEEISIGDYVLTGGEIPAMALIDGITRLLPGVLSSEIAYLDESHFGGLLEHPQYTRPREYRGNKVPDVLLSGHHKNIETFNMKESLRTTYLKRPDLLKAKDFSEKEKAMLQEIIMEESRKEERP